MTTTHDLISLTKDLVVVPSMSGNVETLVEVLEVAKKKLAGFSFTPFVSNRIPSLLFTNKNTDMKNFKIIFNAHLDVVPAPSDQFQPVEKNGRLYGRGSSDTKAGAAAMILVFKELANKLSFPFGLQLTCDEEVSGLNGTDYQIKQGVRGEFIIMSECNNNLKISNQAKGIKILRLTTKGKNSHGAYPWLGENALLRMHEILAPVLRKYPLAKEETFGATVNLTKIEMNNAAANKIPDNCTAFLDIRFPLQDKDTIIENIKSLLPKDVTIVIDDSRNVHYTDPLNKYVVLLQSLTEKIHGKKLPLRFAHGTSDAPYYTEVGCDAVEFGPIGHGAHENNEWVDIKSLNEYYEILKHFLLTVDEEHKKTTKDL